MKAQLLHGCDGTDAVILYLIRDGDDADLFVIFAEHHGSLPFFCKFDPLLRQFVRELIVVPRVLSAEYFHSVDLTADTCSYDILKISKFRIRNPFLFNISHYRFCQRMLGLALEGSCYL